MELEYGTPEQNKIEQNKTAKKKQESEGVTQAQIDEAFAAQISEITNGTSPASGPMPMEIISFDDIKPPLSAYDEALLMAYESYTPQKNMTKEDVVALAKSMGLEISNPKRIYIKHSYSITPESKEKFSLMCKSLGIKMQDAMEECMQDFFNKYESQFLAVKQAKNL